MRNPTKTIFWALAAAVLVAGCADGPMAPEMADADLNAAYAKGGNGPNHGGENTSGDEEGPPVVLKWITPLQSSLTVEKLCRPSEECLLQIGEVGATLLVDEGSLSEPSVITMTALAGEHVNFRFGPHGMQFKRAVRVDVDIERTDAKGKQDYVALYWVDSLEDVQEEIPVMLRQGWLRFFTDHFSGYAIAM